MGSKNSEDGSYKAAIPVSVVKVPVIGVRLNKIVVVMNGKKTERLIAIIKPGNATVKDVVWSSNNCVSDVSSMMGASLEAGSFFTLNPYCDKI